ncbi:TnsA-like heteromeric transposase endonuclease subunit [Streptomyces sp. NPDC051636]|uniref:TnsA-like heteromeric transposase endonuclease subunit n=1 Tax=Streptomyces sp. NPDC051636 TaxID=3365663 RepID=UPI0037AB7B84
MLLRPGNSGANTVADHIRVLTDANESWLERDHLILLDRDPQVLGIASQPFWLHWHDGARRRRHAPDYFVRLADGRGRVVDVRADDRVDDAAAESFEAMELACRAVGWEFVRAGMPDPVFMANVRWLARYRRRRCLRWLIAARLLDAFEEPAPLLEGVVAAGDQLVVLPVLFHLIGLASWPPICGASCCTTTASSGRGGAGEADAAARGNRGRVLGPLGRPGPRGDRGDHDDGDADRDGRAGGGRRARRASARGGLLGRRYPGAPAAAGGLAAGDVPEAGQGKGPVVGGAHPGGAARAAARRRAGDVTEARVRAGPLADGPAAGQGRRADRCRAQSGCSDGRQLPAPLPGRRGRRARGPPADPQEA